MTGFTLDFLILTRYRYRTVFITKRCSQIYHPNRTLFTVLKLKYWIEADYKTE